MNELLNYQRSFYKSIFTHDYNLLEKYFNRMDDLKERLNIYTNNIFSSLKKILMDDFPFCEKILKKQKFNQASFEFIRNFPPTSGCLLHYGQKFPSFLGVLFPEFPWIRDVAQLEWAKKELYYTSDTSSLDPAVLNSISSEKYSSLTFEFPKAIFFFKSNFYLSEIWQDNKNAEDNFQAPQSIPSFSLMIRPKYQVQHYWLSEEDFTFLQALYRQKTLEEAYKEAAAIKTTFNLAEALRQAFIREYFTKASIL